MAKTAEEFRMCKYLQALVYFDSLHHNALNVVSHEQHCTEVIMTEKKKKCEQPQHKIEGWPKASYMLICKLIEKF